MDRMQGEMREKMEIMLQKQEESKCLIVQQSEVVDKIEKTA